MGDAAKSRPVVLFDVMDTIVTDPFFQRMPKFFNMDMKELLAAKHPTAWLEFEKGEITAQELIAKFFKDGREFDHEGLISMMIDGYEYIDGMEEILIELKESGAEMHTLSNYPEWWRNIEKKLALSRYMDWTFVSCEGSMRGFRKPDPAAYEAVMNTLQREPTSLVFVDDRAANVEAAAALGMDAILFEGSQPLRAELTRRGLL